MHRSNHARLFRRLTVIAAMLLSTACADSGVEAVLDGLPVWTLSEGVRIGSVDDPDYAFTYVLGLEVGPDGTIYSLHPQDAVVRRWTADGKPSGVLGGRGEGPGEFSNPRTMGWRGDSLWVMDANHRTTVFTPEGSLARTITPQVDLGTLEQSREGYFPPRPMELLADGTVYALTPAFSSAVVQGELTSLTHVRNNIAGATLDTLAILPIGPESVLGVLRDDGGGTFTAQPFTDGVVAAISSDGSGLLVLRRRASQEAGPDEFQVTRVDLAGDTVFSRAYSYRPTPLPRATVDSAVDAQAESLYDFVGERTGTTMAQWQGWVAEAMYAPPFYAPVSDMVPGRDGTIWLGLNPPVAGMREWLLLSPDGDPLGRVQAPEGTRVLACDTRHIWGVETDDLEVPYIVRYEVVQP